MKKHTTHFDDCGCLSAAKDKRIKELEGALKAYATCTRVGENGLQYCICKYEPTVHGKAQETLAQPSETSGPLEGR